VYVAQPGQAWGRALTPQANTPPVPPRPAEAPLAIGARREPADLRREIDARMSKMREEMNRLREEMNRLREELRRQEDQAR
jgi:HAMP domain-containing protein